MNNLIEWPEVFNGDDSQAWRNISDYAQRMKLIAFHAVLNLSLIAEENE